MGIKEKVLKIPALPGVYFFLGDGGSVLYIGKASNLKKRIASYFQKKYHPPRTASLVSRIKDLDYIVTSSAAEALIHEANFIKEKKPRYNVELKDDKSYPYLKLTVNEKFPRLLITRDASDKGALYYGPYTNVKLLRKALSEIKRVFLLRSCGKLPKKACLKAHINRCVAPCDGSISEEEYKKIVLEVRLFLEGRKADLLKELSRRMKEASEKREYEKALSIRDKIESLSAMWKGRKPPPALDREIKELKRVLKLKTLPARIEAFDISNISGREAVGSMVSFFSAKPQKDEYRRFRIKKVTGIDDYAMIKEVINRRYSRLLEKGGNFPDLILIDGGRGHLNVAFRELENLGPLKIPVISIAKEREDIYVMWAGKPLRLSRRSAALKLLMRIRDEAHRFAISYHKLLRGKDLLKSSLDEIPGVGEKRKKALINRFGSTAKLKEASPGEISRVKGMDEKTAKKVIRYIKEK